jgi:hypothetical protein
MYNSYTMVLSLMCGSRRGPRDIDLDGFETKLRCQQEALPKDLQLLSENTSTHHFEVESSGLYIRLHALYHVCMLEMGEMSSKQPVALCHEPFFEMLKSFHESQMGAPRARVFVAGFAAYSISRSTYSPLCSTY